MNVLKCVDDHCETMIEMIMGEAEEFRFRYTETKSPRVIVYLFPQVYSNQEVQTYIARK